MDPVGVREENKAVALCFERVNDFPHGEIERENIFPGRGEFVLAQGVF